MMACEPAALLRKHLRVARLTHGARTEAGGVFAVSVTASQHGGGLADC